MFFGIIPTILTTRKYYTHHPPRSLLFMRRGTTYIHYNIHLQQLKEILRQTKYKKGFRVECGHIGTLQTSTVAD